MARLFGKQGQQYAASRPTYPVEFLRYIASKTPGRRLAWDVGTGTGQAAAVLASLFESVVATDASKEQIAHAPADIPNIRFLHAPADLPLEDLHLLVAPPASIDLITIAQALHWFDLPVFYDHARAMLRPGGVLAAWCYTGTAIDLGNSRAAEIYRDIYAALDPYWAEERRLVEAGYAGIDFPFHAVDGEDGTRPSVAFAAERTMTAKDFLEYVRSWSAYQTAKENGIEVLTDQVAEELARVWADDGHHAKKITFPLSLRIGRVSL